MLATVTSLDHQSRESVAQIAAKTEEKLRNTCTKVFAEIGEALRDRMQQVAARLETPAPSPSPSGENPQGA
jgi:hypothetical protein